MPSATRDDSSAAKRSSSRGRRGFATTRWSIVLAAGRANTSDAGAALSHLCQTYWRPIYAHVRRCGHSPESAQDLTQSFFARLIERQLVARADPARGRFRSFVLASLNHFLTDEWEKANARKRGSGTIFVSLDATAAERDLAADPMHAPAPDAAFDRQWALALLAEVMKQLEDEYRAADKAGHFSLLKIALTGSRDAQPYAQLAVQLGSTEGAVKVAVHRLRRRYRELLEREIAETVGSREDVADELRHLFLALASP